eukprot:scaffold125706_cov56-Attheya_sp.AAC.2
MTAASTGTRRERPGSLPLCCCLPLCLPTSSAGGDFGKRRRIASKRSQNCNPCHPQHRQKKQQRICRKPYIEVEDDVYKAVLYQCGGEDYYEFHNSLQSLWSESLTERPFWGRRESPAPRNTNILVWGNSHTRQVVEAMLCQYEDKIVDSYLEEEDEGEGNYLGWVQLEHNVTIMWVINTWHSFTGDRWRHLLETYVLQSMTKVPASNGDHITNLTDFDVLLLGKFNRTSSDVSTKKKGRAFYRSMYKNKKEHPKLIDFDTTTPGLSQISSALNGAAVGLTPFAPDDRTQNHMQTEAAQSNRANGMVLEGRHYMDVLGECVGMIKEGVGSCVNQTVGHRYAGAYGGHADVMVWDIVKTLHQIV